MLFRSCVLSSESALGPRFAQLVERTCVTTLPGVPFSLELYVRTRLFARGISSLRTVTTSGGRVGKDLLAELQSQLAPAGVGLWCMYGQTEASGRISALPPAELVDAPGSVGRAIPGTQITIEDPDESGTGTVVVHGPGNMLGYAFGAADLGTTSDPVVALDTGDLGQIGRAHV